jgi:predicted GNAT family acetyltransferase
MTDPAKPSAQGQGISRRLIETTLADADDAGVDCYFGDIRPSKSRSAYADPEEDL